MITTNDLIDPISYVDISRLRAFAQVAYAVTP